MNLSYSTETASLSQEIFEDRTQTRLIVFAFFGGMMINLASIFIGNPYTIIAIVAVISLPLTLYLTDYEVPWMLLVSVMAANPVNLQMTIASNLIFAFWLIFFHGDYLHALPRWIFALTSIAMAGVLCSSVTWLFSVSKFDALNQLASMVNYVLGPFLMLPVIYFRAEKEHLINGRTLLVFLVLPSIIVTLLAYLFGHPLATGLNMNDLQTNLFTYAFGKTEFQFIRTHVGFLLASFICSSVAVMLCDSGVWSRMLAGVLAGISFFLLLVTGSIASTISCIIGLTAMLVIGFRFLPIQRFLTFVFTTVILFVSIWALSPKIVQDYVASHYEERFSGDKVNNSDRDERWGASARYILRNPTGVGWSLYVEEIRVYPHNDYLAYGIAYGFIGGIGYASLLLVLLWGMVRSLEHIRYQSQLSVILAGIGVLIVVIINSFTDHMSANRWYFNVVWSIIWFAYFGSRSYAEAGDEE